MSETIAKKTKKKKKTEQKEENYKFFSTNFQKCRFDLMLLTIRCI